MSTICLQVISGNDARYVVHPDLVIDLYFLNRNVGAVADFIAEAKLGNRSLVIHVVVHNKKVADVSIPQAITNLCDTVRLVLEQDDPAPSTTSL